MNESGDLLRQATALLQARKPAAAAALYEKILADRPEDADALHLLGIAHGRRGATREALALFRRAIALRGDVAVFHLNLARALIKIGEREGAIEALRRASALDASEDAARSLLASQLLPGPIYLEVLKKLHDLLQPATYLEIGVESGRTLALALPPTRAIGVDPAPQIVVRFIAETKVFKATSDEFFARVDVAAEFGQPTIDLAFIDGLHLFEQSLRDFINVERHCGPRSVVLVHDCLPVDDVSAARERQAPFWTGDVWKTVAILKRWRPDLEIRTVATWPSGLAVITGLDPASRVLAEKYEEIVAQFMDRMPPLEKAAQEEILARHDNDLAELESWLRKRGYGV